MQEIAAKIVKDKLVSGMLEHSQGPYRSSYFLVRKNRREYRFIDDMQLLNKVTIRDADMMMTMMINPPAVGLTYDVNGC